MAVYSFDFVTPLSVSHRLSITKLLSAWKNTMALKQGDQALDQIRGAHTLLTLTGSNNDVALPDAATHLIRTSASDTTLTGLTGGRDGRMVLVHNNGTGFLRLTHDDAASLAANRFKALSARGQILGVGGSALLNYLTGSGWFIHLLHPGQPITPTFAAGDYTASGSMTWGVDSADVVLMKYQQLGKLLRMTLGIQSSTVGGTVSTALRRTLPNGFTASQVQHGSLFRSIDNGTEVRAFAYFTGTLVEIYKDGAANWTLSTNATQVFLPWMDVEVL